MCRQALRFWRRRADARSVFQQWLCSRHAQRVAPAQSQLGPALCWRAYRQLASSSFSESLVYRESAPSIVYSPSLAILALRSGRVQKQRDAGRLWPTSSAAAKSYCSLDRSGDVYSSRNTFRWFYNPHDLPKLCMWLALPQRPQYRTPPDALQDAANTTHHANDARHHARGSGHRAAPAYIKIERAALL